ncbi:YebC/PmpR family DNA-binding transcriptional regulator [Spiroplasma endosymbiont of Crioceris asparagi]|uniref:YebC/PmpR family DNA-binding transcriptional regulator n=1 Tax=Spiroplasma endosymbiont of Crioceris asparagi TaxID=3066286 RepID=UPI0030D144C5
MGRAFEVRKQSMAKTGAVKSAINGRAAKEIYLAAKQGGSVDPNANLALRAAIDKAKTKQVPNDTIQRALKRAQGNDHENYVSNRYEGYGPSGSMIIVDSLTSNVNRAISEIRDVFNKNGGKLATAGAVSYAFHDCSVFGFDEMNVEQTFEYLFEAEVEINDVVEEDEMTIVYAPFTAFNDVKKALDKKIKNYKIAETTMLANEEVILDGENKIKFEKLCDKLNELEDVQNLYHNVKE